MRYKGLIVMIEERRTTDRRTDVDKIRTDKIGGPPDRSENSRTDGTMDDGQTAAQMTVPARDPRGTRGATDHSPPLDAKDTTFVQQVCGTFLYYARAVDNTMLVAINELGTQQSEATFKTLKAVPSY